LFASFGGLGLSATALPNVLWVDLQEAAADHVTREMLARLVPARDHRLPLGQWSATSNGTALACRFVRSQPSIQRRRGPRQSESSDRSQRDLSEWPRRSHGRRRGDSQGTPRRTRSS